MEWLRIGGFFEIIGKVSFSRPKQIFLNQSNHYWTTFTRFYGQKYVYQSMFRVPSASSINAARPSIIIIRDHNRQFYIAALQFWY